MKKIINIKFKKIKTIFPTILRRSGLAKYLNIVYKTRFDGTFINIPIIGGEGESLLRIEKDWKYDLFKILSHKKKEFIFVDVGANIGQTFLEILLALGSKKEKLRYYAFEPNVDCFYILKKFVYFNVNKATLFPWALSNKNNFEKIYLINNYDTGGAIIPSIRSRNKCDSSFISSYKLDSNDQLELSSGFILKIDVEGYENEVLEGALEVVKNYRPIIICEVLHADSKELIRKNTIRKKELSEFFKKINYQIWQIHKSDDLNEGRLLGIELISDFPTGLCWWDSPSSIDFLITPKENNNQFRKLKEYLKNNFLADRTN